MAGKNMARSTHAEPAYYLAPDGLGCRFVIHAVRPVRGMANEDQKLADAIWAALRLAERLNLKIPSLSPAISTGIFGFPKDACLVHF